MFTAAAGSSNVKWLWEFRHLFACAWNWTSKDRGCTRLLLLDIYTSSTLWNCCGMCCLLRWRVLQRTPSCFFQTTTDIIIWSLLCSLSTVRIIPANLWAKWCISIRIQLIVSWVERYDRIQFIIFFCYLYKTQTSDIWKIKNKVIYRFLCF